MVNKQLLTNRTLEAAKDYIRPCLRLSMHNIVTTEWNNLELLNMIFKEHKWQLTNETAYQTIKSIFSAGNQLSNRDVFEEFLHLISYDSNLLPEKFVYQPFMSVISGKVSMITRRPFAYPWKHSKIIGTKSPEAKANLGEVLSDITDFKELLSFVEVLRQANSNMFLITTPEEKRLCIEVTRELYEAGLTSCIDWWIPTNENGEAEETKLNIGDFLIVSNDRTRLYYMSREEFVVTHSLEV